MSWEWVVYIVFGALAVAMAARLIFLANPVHAALHLVVVLVSIAVLFLAQGAYFLSAVQVIVYTGAIVVLFLFVIMLLGIDKPDEAEQSRLASSRFVVGVSGAIVAVAVMLLLPLISLFTALPDSPQRELPGVRVDVGDLLAADRYDRVRLATLPATGDEVLLAHMTTPDGELVTVRRVDPALAGQAEGVVFDEDLAIVSTTTGEVQAALEVLPEGEYPAIDPSGADDTSRPDIVVPDYGVSTVDVADDVREIVHVGNVEVVADSLFTTYLLPFEVVSILLVAGIIGGIVLAKRERGLHGAGAGRSDEAYEAIARHEELGADPPPARAPVGAGPERGQADA